jgi:hypothetical protein
MHRIRKVFHYVSDKISNESGAILVMFALMLPLLLLFYSMAFDSAKVQRENARLADGMNQAALAVAFADNRDQTTPSDRQLLRDYLQYYLPGADIPDDGLSITARINYFDDAKQRPKSVDYGVSGVAVMHPVFTNKTVQPQGIGYSKDISTRVGSGAGHGSGVVRKTLAKFAGSADYVFVVDFSGSMSSGSLEPGMNRIQLLHKVVKDFGRKVLDDNPDTTIGFVPFSIGVPVKSTRYNNDMPGGFELECSWVGELRTDYNLDSKTTLNLRKFNPEFWYNKNGTPGTTEMIQRKRYDESLYDYYKNILTGGLGLTFEQMVDRGWCVKNSSTGNGPGRAEYSCDASPRTNMFNNTAEFTDTYLIAQKFMDLTDSSPYTYLTNDTLDFDAMFADEGYLFSDAAVKTHPLFYTYLGKRPFRYMCGSAFAPSTVNNSSQVIKSIKFGKKTGSYLIELSSDPAVLDEFSQMDITDDAVSARTDSSSGLLRALPVIAKGVNPRKIIIIISDGDDTPEPQKVADTLHKTHKVCDRIRTGLRKYSAAETTSVDLYFISLTTGASRVKYWADNCVGADHAFTARKYQELIDTLTGIVQKESLHFVNDRD